MKLIGQQTQELKPNQVSQKTKKVKTRFVDKNKKQNNLSDALWQQKVNQTT